jgi:hypothetical protein
MEGAASTAEQAHYAQRLIAVGERLQRRTYNTSGPVIEGQVLAARVLALPVHTVKPRWGV